MLSNLKDSNESSIVQPGGISSTLETRGQDINKRLPHKRVIIWIVMVFVLVLLGALGLVIAFNQEDRSKVSVGGGVSELESKDTIVSQDKYTKEYFDQALKENRVLTDEEKSAYFKLTVKKNTILEAIVYNKEVHCVFPSQESTSANVSRDVYIKDGKVRVNDINLKDGSLISNTILTNEKQWSWSQVEDYPNGYINLNGESDKLNWLTLIFWDTAESSEMYLNSCKEEVVDKDVFIPSEDIDYKDYSDLTRESLDSDLDR